MFTWCGTPYHDPMASISRTVGASLALTLLLAGCGGQSTPDNNPGTVAPAANASPTTASASQVLASLPTEGPVDAPTVYAASLARLTGKVTVKYRVTSSFTLPEQSEPTTLTMSHEVDPRVRYHKMTLAVTGAVAKNFKAGNYVFIRSGAESFMTDKSWSEAKAGKFKRLSDEDFASADLSGALAKAKDIPAVLTEFTPTAGESKNGVVTMTGSVPLSAALPLYGANSAMVGKRVDPATVTGTVPAVVSMTIKGELLSITLDGPRATIPADLPDGMQKVLKSGTSALYIDGVGKVISHDIPQSSQLIS